MDCNQLKDHNPGVQFTDRRRIGLDLESNRVTSDHLSAKANLP
jgi:hypothetical protein